MRASEFRKVYLASIRLYGFITSSQIIDLLNHYNLQFTEKELLSDLKSKVGKKTRDYCVYQGYEDQYLVTGEYENDDSLDNLTNQKAGKPMYYPKTFEDFLKYSDFLYRDKNYLEAHENISKFLTAKLDFNPFEVSVLTVSILFELERKTVTQALNILNEFNVSFKNDKDFERFLKIIMKYGNNLRLKTNNGFTPNELSEMYGPVDLNKTMLTIGTNMRQNMIDGISNPYEMLAQLDKSDLPVVAKESLRKQLIEIIDIIEHNKKS